MPGLSERIASRSPQKPSEPTVSRCRWSRLLKCLSEGRRGLQADMHWQRWPGTFFAPPAGATPSLPTSRMRGAPSQVPPPLTAPSPAPTSSPGRCSPAPAQGGVRCGGGASRAESAGALPGGLQGRPAGQAAVDGQPGCSSAHWLARPCLVRGAAQLVEQVEAQDGWVVLVGAPAHSVAPLQHLWGRGGGGGADGLGGCRPHRQPSTESSSQLGASDITSISHCSFRESPSLSCAHWRLPPDNGIRK